MGVGFEESEAKQVAQKLLGNGGAMEYTALIINSYRKRVLTVKITLFIINSFHY